MFGRPNWRRLGGASNESGLWAAGKLVGGALEQPFDGG